MYFGFNNSEIEAKIDEWVKGFYSDNVSSGTLINEEREVELFDGIKTLMEDKNVPWNDYSIKKAIFARARFYSIAWVEDGYLYHKVIEADAC